MKQNKLNGINLNGLQVSDLFFNHENTNFNNVDRMTGTPEEIDFRAKAALLQDATEFSEMIGSQITPDELMKDFLARV